MNSNHYAFGLVTVVWNADDSINSITYGGKSLFDAVREKARHIRIGPTNVTLSLELNNLIIDLLNSIADLPVNEQRRKIFLADKLFEHLQIDTEPSNPKLRSWIWREILSLVWQWEDKYEEVHKGTAYYFMAATYLSLGDVPSAYTCFFNALEEDKKNFPRIPKNLKDAPTYRTTSLIDNPNNALYYAVVIPLRRHLQAFIDRYNRIRRGTNLTLRTLDQKFLQADTFLPISHVHPHDTTRAGLFIAP